MKAEDKLLKIINNYGVMPQLKYFQSEVFELNEAIIDYDLSKELSGFNEEDDNELKEHIAEEIADVMVLLEQFKLYYEIPEKEVIRIFWEKVERQLERIENEKGII